MKAPQLETQAQARFARKRTPAPQVQRASEFYKTLGQALRGDDEFFRAIADMYAAHVRQARKEGVQEGRGKMRMAIARDAARNP